MWFDTFRKQSLISTSDTFSNRNRNLSVSGRYPNESHFMTMFIPALFDKKRPSSLTFWNGDVINNVMSAWNITCTAIHLHLCTRYQFIVCNSSPPGRNGRHFADDICKCIFLNENVLLSIKIPLKFIPNGPISNIPALVQIMAWRRPGHYLNQYWPNSLTHICGIRSRWVKLSGICIHQMIMYASKISMYTCKIIMYTYRIIMYICKICIHNRMYFYTRQNLFMQLINLCCDVPSGPPYLNLSLYPVTLFSGVSQSRYWPFPGNSAVSWTLSRKQFLTPGACHSNNISSEILH